MRSAVPVTAVMPMPVVAVAVVAVAMVAVTMVVRVVSAISVAIPRRIDHDRRRIVVIHDGRRGRSIAVDDRRRRVGIDRPDRGRIVLWRCLVVRARLVSRRW